jgi:thioredoxin reductase
VGVALVSKIYDISIIGGGPIGLFAAGIAGEQGALCNIIESRLHLGGIMMAAYPEKDVYNFPGFQVIKGRDLINELASKAKSFGAVTKFGEYVSDIRKGSSNTIIVKSNKGEYLSSTVILATGLKAQYSPLAELIDIRGWDGSGIYESWPPIESIGDKRVAIITGPNGDIDIPDEIASNSKDFIWLLSNSKIASRDLRGEIIRHPWKVIKIIGEKIPGYVLLKNEQSGKERSFEIDAVISLVDLQPRQTLYSNLGIEIVGSQVKVDQRMQTSMKRVYAVGDIAYYPGKIKLLSTGLYEAKIAVKNVLKII